MVKIFAKKASWIYILILILAVVIGGIIQQKIYGEPSDNWREETQTELNQLKRIWKLLQMKIRNGLWSK